MLQGIADELRASDQALVNAVVRISHAVLAVERSVLLAYQERAAEALAREALTDSLTGLANRRYFEDRAAQELQRARRSELPLAVVLIDLDGLKATNDTRGHAAGDRLLRDFAALLRGQLRGIDLAARFGGDEFAALLPDTDAAGAGVLVERLERRAAAHEGAGGPIRFSTGTAIYPDQGETLDALLEQADIALYRDKRDEHP
jgi:diguanylate cyclase (GGDEF)-like protein